MVAVSTVDVCRFRLRTALHRPLPKSLLRPESADSGRKNYFRTRTVPGDQSPRPFRLLPNAQRTRRGEKRNPGICCEDRILRGLRIILAKRLLHCGRRHS